MAEAIYYNDKTIKVHLKTILTGKLRKEIIDLLKHDPIIRQQQDSSKIVQELIAEGIDIDTMNEYQLGLLMIKKGLNIEVDEEEYQRFIYRFASCVLDIDKYDNELKNLLSEVSDTTIEFWNNQDIEYWEGVLDSFRTRIKRTAKKN